MDKRAARSRERIQVAFAELLGEVGYDRLTVGDILARAGVGRATFYAHFRGKDDLLAAQVEAICDFALAGGEPASVQSPLAAVERVLTNLHERENGVRALVAGEGSERFADCLRHAVVARARAELPEHPQGPAAHMNREFLVHHIGASFVGMVRWWAWTDFASSPHDLAQDYLRAIMPLFGQ